MSPHERREYTSQLRAERTQQTRRRIVAAAAGLFAANGYGATSIQSIADSAGVSRKTVFDAVGGKVQLMKLAYDFAIVGDHEQVPLSSRPVTEALRTEPDAAVMLASYASVIVGVDRRIAGVWRALEGASANDPQARELYESLSDQRRAAMNGPARRLADLGALREGVSEQDAADLLWFFNDPTLWDKLVRQRNWGESQFERWLSFSLQVNLLD